MNIEEIERLREIQREISLPFAPQEHDIRDLPGKGQWIYVPHHKYRIRACEIYPGLEIEFGQYNQIEKHTMVKCVVSIMSVKREAWGIVETSPTGERGNCFDRATAEATKNALEMWGMGAYLDDQPRAARIMGKAFNLLPHEKKVKFMNYCKALKIELEIIQESTKKSNEEIIARSQELSKEKRQLLIAEIDSLMKRKNVSVQMGRDWISRLYAAKSRFALTDEQLNDFLTKMRQLKATEDEQKNKIWEYNGQILWKIELC